MWKGTIKYKCSEYCDVVYLKLTPNEEIKKHQHSDSEEIAFIISGSGKIGQKKVSVNVKQNDLIFLEKNVSHLYTSGRKGMNILIFHALPMHNRKLIELEK